LPANVAKAVPVEDLVDHAEVAAVVAAAATVADHVVEAADSDGVRW
jgi:hypothetical protein